MGLGVGFGVGFLVGLLVGRTLLVGEGAVGLTTVIFVLRAEKVERMSFLSSACRSSLGEGAEGRKEPT